VWQLLRLGSRGVESTGGSSVQGRAVLRHSGCALVVSVVGVIVGVPNSVDGVQDVAEGGWPRASAPVCC
jgi:hypothetical protein